MRRHPIQQKMMLIQFTMQLLSLGLPAAVACSSTVVGCKPPQSGDCQPETCGQIRLCLCLSSLSQNPTDLSIVTGLICRHHRAVSIHSPVCVRWELRPWADRCKAVFSRFRFILKYCVTLRSTWQSASRAKRKMRFHVFANDLFWVQLLLPKVSLNGWRTNNRV